ncbi:MAG: putative kinase [Phormidium sp. OSCR]|nr:MAG: putative kinase [Phormidium sp. OSCR]
MSISLPCHFLVGVPASGKSHFAQEVVKRDPRYVVVSTDAVREKLYGDAIIQGNWREIEAEVLTQIQAAIAQERPVIYDATNVRRSWRVDFLQLVKDLSDTPLTWVAWVMEVPVEVCKQRNGDRPRVVPNHVIERMAESLAQTPVTTAEGFEEVRSLPLTPQGDIDFPEVFKQLDRLSMRLAHRNPS